MMPRDGAGCLDLVGGTREVTHLLALPDYLEAHKVDRTFQVESPDIIDPKRTKPDVPFLWRVSDDAGSANQVVARVFFQCAEALKNKRLERGDNDSITVALHGCKEELRNCEKAFVRMATEYDAIVETIKTAGGLRAKKGLFRV